MPRGVSNRNTGLAWLRKYASDGVAYFADDDNTYDVRLFTEVSNRAGGVHMPCMGWFIVVVAEE